jgi:hypothetical protein
MVDITAATLTQTTSHCEPLQPEWLRLPDAIRFSGIGRSRLYQLIDGGKIRSVCLRDRQKVRGIRLVSAKSLSDYISSFEGDGKGQDNGNDKKNARRAGKHGRAKAAAN